jgi:hypothetical protein
VRLALDLRPCHRVSLGGRRDSAPGSIHIDSFPIEHFNALQEKLLQIHQPISNLSLQVERMEEHIDSEFHLKQVWE